MKNLSVRPSSELEDFNPRTGHLHVCGAGTLPSSGSCRCAADLYEIAAFLTEATERVAQGWESEPPGDIARHYAAARLRTAVSP